MGSTSAARLAQAAADLGVRPLRAPEASLSFATAFLPEKSALAPGQPVVVQVCFTRSPDFFFVQPENIDDELGKMSARLQESFDRCPPLAHPEIGQPCAAIFEGNDLLALWDLS